MQLSLSLSPSLCLAMLHAPELQQQPAPERYLPQEQCLIPGLSSCSPHHVRHQAFLLSSQHLNQIKSNRIDFKLNNIPTYLYDKHCRIYTVTDIYQLADICNMYRVRDTSRTVHLIYIKHIHRISICIEHTSIVS